MLMVILHTQAVKVQQHSEPWSVLKLLRLIRYSSLWKREVRRDFCGEDIIIKSPLSPLWKRGVFSRQ
jgi:hypothetical protein